MLLVVAVTVSVSGAVGTVGSLSAIVIVVVVLGIKVVAFAESVIAGAFSVSTTLFISL